MTLEPATFDLIAGERSNPDFKVMVPVHLVGCPIASGDSELVVRTKAHRIDANVDIPWIGSGWREGDL